MVRLLTVLSITLTCVTLVQAQETLEQQITAACNQAVVLRQQGKIPESIKVLESTAAAMQPRLEANSDAGESLQRAMEEADRLSDLSARQTRLYWGLQEAKLAINYAPIMEAPLPEGFPEPGKVGVPTLKHYPAYRAARTTMRGGDAGQDSAFWRLFNHIKKRDIPMTAPVEMVYEKPADSGGMAQAMLFMYESLQQGRNEKDDEVEVVDLPEMTVVSVGMRGSFDATGRARAMAKLQSWLKENQATYRVGGPMRILGYNSPFVLPMLRYYEVQIPVIELQQ